MLGFRCSKAPFLLARRSIQKKTKLCNSRIMNLQGLLRPVINIFARIPLSFENAVWLGARPIFTARSRFSVNFTKNSRFWSALIFYIKWIWKRLSVVGQDIPPSISSRSTFVIWPKEYNRFYADSTIFSRKRWSYFSIRACTFWFYRQNNKKAWVLLWFNVRPNV